jgi:predicted site-specific integrase-resolvase
MYVEEALELLGISYNTLKAWAKKGRLRRVREEGPNAKWIYNDDDVYAMIGKRIARDLWVTTYSRVNGTQESHRRLMQEQRLRLQDWCTARGLVPDQAYEDWAPSTEYGLDTRPGLHLLLQDVIQGRVSVVVIDSPCRLARLGHEVFTEIFRYYGVQCIFLNRTISRPEYLAEQEEDLLRLLKRAGVERLSELGTDLPKPKRPKLKDPGRIVPHWDGAPLPPNSRDLDPELGDLM